MPTGSSAREQAEFCEIPRPTLRRTADSVNALTSLVPCRPLRSTEIQEDHGSSHARGLTIGSLAAHARSNLNLLLPVVLGAVATLAPHTAKATYSIIAYDRTSGTFGGAVASCVPLDTVELVYAATPADATTRGALVTQSYLLDGAGADALDGLSTGMTAGEVLGALVDPAYDSAFALRQYAVVDESGSVAAFSGEQALPLAAHQTFEIGPYVGSVQGNVLTDAEVILLATSAFASAEHCGLGERLLRALEAAGEPPHGDSRCLVHNKRALSATLGIDPPTGPPLRLGMNTQENDIENPVGMLRAAFDAMGVDSCGPPEPPANGAGGSSGGGVDDETEQAMDGCSVTRRLGSTPAPWLGVAFFSAVVAIWRARRRRGSSPHSPLRGSCSPHRARR